MSQHKFLKDICAFWGLTAFAVLLTLVSFSDAYAQPICGETITEDTTLTADLDCTTTDGLIIGADNITIDLNSNTVTGVTCNGCYGIDNTNGFDDVTIKSGSIVGFNHGVHGRNNADRFVLDDLSFSGQTGTWWERYSIDIRAALVLLSGTHPLLWLPLFSRARSNTSSKCCKCPSYKRKCCGWNYRRKLCL